MSKKYPNETPEEYKARRYAQRRQWAIDHPEKTREYGRAFYKRNAEKRKAYSNAYNHAHLEERRAYGREYYRRKKAAEQARTTAKALALTEPQCAHERLVKHCQRTLSQYCYTSMERARAICSERVERYFLKYPFECYGDGFIRYTLRKLSVFPDRAEYADCYDAGMIAYLYSIHRCAVLDCDYTIPYIRKMIRIYAICALIVYKDAHNLCRINGIREIRIDADENGRLY